MTYDNTEQFPADYWDELNLVESQGDIQLMVDSKGERIYYCDRCGAVVEGYDSEYEC